ncbi:hypothetical protein, partial [Bifidobacterium animalis]|uniref:hypothetical protein n=4 Tax=Bifidobacterium animalis TaxID=28025 RepID=UPI001C5AEEB2
PAGRERQQKKDLHHNPHPRNPTPNHTPPNPNKHNTTTGVSKTQHHTPKPRRELGCTQSELHKEKPNGQKTPPIHWSVVSPGG